MRTHSIHSQSLPLYHIEYIYRLYRRLTKCLLPTSSLSYPYWRVSSARSATSLPVAPSVTSHLHHGLHSIASVLYSSTGAPMEIATRDLVTDASLIQQPALACSCVAFPLHQPNHYFCDTSTSNITLLNAECDPGDGWPPRRQTLPSLPLPFAPTFGPASLIPFATTILSLPVNPVCMAACLLEEASPYYHTKTVLWESAEDFIRNPQLYIFCLLAVIIGMRCLKQLLTMPCVIECTLILWVSFSASE